MGVSSGLVIRIPSFHCHGLGSIPGQGTEIPQATQSTPPPKKGVFFFLKNGIHILTSFQRLQYEKVQERE